MLRLVRYCSVVLLVGLATSVGGGLVHAATPGTVQNPSCNPSMTECHWSTVTDGSISDWADCPSFTVSALYTVRRDYTDFYDGSGNLLRELRHVQYQGTLTNTSTGASISYEGDFLREVNNSTGTLRITGLNTKITLPSGRSEVIDSGYTLIDANGDVIVRGQANDATVCAALS